MPIPSSSGTTSDRVDWKKSMVPHEQASAARSALDLATSVLPYLVLTVAMYLCLDVSVWLTLALAIPAGGFLLRTFIIFHDCTHGSFMATKRGNLWVGRLTGLLVFQPFANWRHNHAVHHGSSGDLDRRGTGDVMTLTVDEYYARTPKQKLGYRLFRNPLVMFGHRPDLVADDRPADLVEEAAPADAPQRLADEPRARRRHRRDLLVRRPRGLAAGADADRDHRRHRRRLDVLRPAPVRGRLLGEIGRAGATTTPPCRAAPT